MKNKTLNDFKKNVFSQYGEDGIIEEVLHRLNLSKGVCVEFGAWDGVLFSNTANLWAKNEWKGILIEADKSRFEVLKKVVKDYDCIPINGFVTSSGLSSVESLLEKEKIKFEDVKVLSIDIDGNEYHILNQLKSLCPALIVSEYNPTIPPEMNVVSKEDAFFGSSAKAITELMESKGYFLAAMTTSNCFFIDKKFIDLFLDLDVSFEALFDRSCLTYLITGYRGDYAFSQSPAFGIGLPLDKNLIERGVLFFISYSSFKVRLNYLKHSIKQIGKKIIGINNITSFKEGYKYFIWKLKGMPVPAHGKYKWMIIKKYTKRYNINTFVETGTAGGGTVIEMAKYFKKLYTIELLPTFHHIAKAKGAENKNIVFLEGDSGFLMKEVLQKLDEPALFWLDAHYSGNGTARGAIDTPIVQELTSIFKHKNKNHIIIIDDAREFNGTHDYPELSELKKIIKSEAPWLTISQDNDILIIEPILKNK